MSVDNIIKIKHQEDICKRCAHNDDPYYCGSFCIYGDCFELKKEVENKDNPEEK